MCKILRSGCQPLALAIIVILRLSQRIDTLQTKQLIVLRRRRGAILRCKAQLGAADLQASQALWAIDFNATLGKHRSFPCP